MNSVVDKALEIVDNSLKTLAQDTKRVKGRQSIKIDGNGSENVHIGEITMNMNISMVEVSNNLIQIKKMLNEIQTDNSILIGDNGIIDYNRDRMLIRLFEKALKNTSGNKRKASKLLGISHRTLRNWQIGNRIQMPKTRTLEGDV